MYIYLQIIMHIYISDSIAVYQELTQYCKSTLLQLKRRVLNSISLSSSPPERYALMLTNMGFGWEAM